MPTLELGIYVQKVDKIMQQIGIILPYLVGLSGSEGIIGKKHAWLPLSGYFNRVDFVNGEEV